MVCHFDLVQKLHDDGMRQEKLHEEYSATHDFFNPIIIT